MFQVRSASHLMTKQTQEFRICKSLFLGVWQYAHNLATLSPIGFTDFNHKHFASSFKWLKEVVITIKSCGVNAPPWSLHKSTGSDGRVPNGCASSYRSLCCHHISPKRCKRDNSLRLHNLSIGGHILVGGEVSETHPQLWFCNILLLGKRNLVSVQTLALRKFIKQTIRDEDNSFSPFNISIFIHLKIPGAAVPNCLFIQVYLCCWRRYWWGTWGQPQSWARKTTIASEPCSIPSWHQDIAVSRVTNSGCSYHCWFTQTNRNATKRNSW